MTKKIFVLVFMMFIITGCNSGGNTTTETTQPTSTKVVAIIAKQPTATNFPKIGTPTAVPPTPTPWPTPTPTTYASAAMFDDETLAELMSGTIAAAGVDALIEIVDDRPNGGERVANITIISEHNIDDSDLLLKLFVLEVGNALRTARGFTQGTMQADLDSLYLEVYNKKDELLGTIRAPMSDIIDFLDGHISVNEALKKLDITGVFETLID